MLKRAKIKQVLILALLGIIFLLSIAIVRLYLVIQSGYGKSAGFLASMVATVIILTLICKGIQYAAAIEKAMNGSISMPANQLPITTAVEPFGIDIFGQILCQPSNGKHDVETPILEIMNGSKDKVYEAGSQLPKRRTKHSRFPISKITKAVLAWEQRDPQFSSFTLAEFLKQEFGSGPDGILLMAPTTFYDWRRRVLRDLELKNKNKPNNLRMEA